MRDRGYRHFVRLQCRYNVRNTVRGKYYVHDRKDREAPMFHHVVAESTQENGRDRCSRYVVLSFTIAILVAVGFNVFPSVDSFIVFSISLSS